MESICQLQAPAAFSRVEERVIPIPRTVAFNPLAY
jgi:hypothetical protein